MKYGKVLLFTALSALVGGVSPWLQSGSSGHPVPFTFGTVGAPALMTLAATLLALFTKSPRQP